MKPIKYSVQELLGVGFTLIVLGIGMAYGIDITADIRDDFCDDSLDEGGCYSCPTEFTYNSTGNNCYNTTNSSHNTASRLNAETAEFNATKDTITGLGKITEKIETIAVVVVASVIIGILVTYLWARFARM